MHLVGTTMVIARPKSRRDNNSESSYEFKTAYSCLNFMRRRTREENKVNDFQEIQADLIYTSSTNSKSLT